MGRKKKLLTITKNKIKMKYEPQNSIQDLPDLKYDGYYWASGENKPEFINNENIDLNAVLKELEESLFIQEAMLWNEDEKVSIMINYTDKQRINCYKVTDEELSKTKDLKNEDLMVYESNRLHNQKLKFIEYWEGDKDEFCDGLPVLKMKAQIFVGFDK